MSTQNREYPLRTEVIEEQDLEVALETIKLLNLRGKRNLLELCLFEAEIPALDVITVLDELETRGFFEAPASTKYHGCEAGDLFNHSFMVYLTLKKWTKAGIIEWGYDYSPLLIGIFHDLCKMDSYSLNSSGGGYTYNPEQFPLGHHALASLVYAQGMVKLTEEEILCIRWHMGPYEGQDSWNLYDRAIKEYNTVLWTHQADMYVSKVLGV